jgi:GNAT superfamily N-acetyltransferase
VISKPCFVCGAPIEGEDLAAYGQAGLAHVRAEHAEQVPYPDMNVVNYFEGEARMTGSADRLDEIGPVEVHPVTEGRIDDWLQLFDYDATVGTPQNAGCYCLHPHEARPDEPALPSGHWTDRRAAMIERLRDGSTVGYLAYVDGTPAGWVNASIRGECTLFRRGDARDADTVSIACFAIAPPYRRHGLARALLDAVLADVATRGASRVEAYPFSFDLPAGSGFRGDRRMYEAAGFTEVEIRERETVMERD